MRTESRKFDGGRVEVALDCTSDGLHVWSLYLAQPHNRVVCGWSTGVEEAFAAAQRMIEKEKANA